MPVSYPHLKVVGAQPSNPSGSGRFCFADLWNKVPSSSPPSAQTPEAMEGQDLFKHPCIAFGEGSSTSLVHSVPR